ncbi:hypothetical protein JF729_14660 [Mycobacterium intracellulare]|uniref:hypothetical protein n=1 Tax=Mycobacterium intracellulare TaxID=1767 RepID=UPI001CDA4508|nr:hypothetical protein [Mycobacterium intracellulare]MCA2249024.1 hypothetical protein [Mycobacterium intracellulare]
MRANAADGIEASASPGGNGRVQIRLGVHRFTATPHEAADFARQLLDAVEALLCHSTTVDRDG